MIKSFALATLAIALLSACSDSKISFVKEHPSQNTNYTYGQIFDNRKFCSNIKWKSTKDQNDRDLVEYTCSFKFEKDMLADIIESRAKNIARDVDILERRYDTVRRQVSIQVEQFRNIKDYSKYDEEIRQDLSSLEYHQAALQELKKQTPQSYAKNIHSPNFPMSEAEKIKEAIVELAKQIQEKERLVARIQDDINTATDKKNEHSAYLEETSKTNFEKWNQILSNVDSYKVIWDNSIKNLAEEDERDMRNFFKENVIVTQKIIFLFTQNDAQLLGLEHSANDQKLASTFDDMMLLSFEIAAPTSEKITSQWNSRWLNKIAGLLPRKFGVDEFPHQCTPENGCGPR